MDQAKQVETATPQDKNLVKNLWRKNWLLKLVLIGLYPLTLTYLIWKSHRLPKVVKGILLLVMWFFVLVFTAAFSSPTSQHAYQEGQKAGREATQKKETTEKIDTTPVAENTQPVQTPNEQPQPTATPTPNPTSTPAPTTQVAEKPVEQKPYNIYDDLWKALDTSLKTRKNIDIKYDPSTKTATLLVNENETYWDETAMLNSAYTRLIKYGKTAFTINGVDQVGVNISTKMMDSHGKESVEEVIRVAITKSSYKDYNWDNMQYVDDFYHKMVDAVSVNYINPGIFRKLDLSKIRLNLL